MDKAWTRIKAWWFWFWAIEMAREDEPARGHIAGAGKMVETEPNGHPSDADLVERAVRNAGYLITDGEVPRWAAVRDTFAVGSSSAFHLCRRFGFDPDAMVGCFVEAEEEEREHIGLSSDVCESCGRVSCSFECPARTAIEKELEEGGGAVAHDDKSAGLVTPPPVGKAGGEDFRPGLPPLELIRLHSIWDAESVIDGERVQRRFHFIEQGGALLFKHWEEDADSLRPVTHQGRWSEVAFRPSGWTWEEAERKRVELESLAAAKVADKQPEESRVRIYCWKVGTAFWRKPNGDCPECGKYGHNHRVLPANECGTFVDCQGKHGHPCVLPPDHEGPHAAPDALAECLHAAGNEMVKGGGG